MGVSPLHLSLVHVPPPLKVDDLFCIIYLRIFLVEKKKRGRKGKTGRGQEFGFIYYRLTLFIIILIQVQHPRSLIAMGTIDTNKIVSQYIYIHSSTPFFYESYFFICTQSKSCQIAIYFQAFCFGFSFLKIFFKKEE